MKNLIYLLFVFFALSCQQKIDKKQLENLNGYWEIKAVYQDGKTVKEFTFNPMVDYFFMKNNQGFRKKVQPQFDGSYKTFDNQEDFKVVTENDSIYLHYKTPQSQWKELILEIDAENLKVKNDRNLTYHYQKFKGFSENGSK
ncbi:lipocalin family protein [Mesonia sp. K7]|uniref:lipocalin family protein n=1 Tax=Mesonia sp. K7 TaxID=2218606 RepID=UPI000DA8CDA4|nr:lipocalin family protein [Mesonia sp. K7]PZD78293.1 hypothetical protein DNG35_06225 [Mesonia sp. K7]